MPTGPPLPIELIGIILEALSSDKSTLSNCSLVCRHWVPLSRFYLFRRITIDREVLNRPTDELARFISSRPYLAAYVRELSIADRRGLLDTGRPRTPFTNRDLAIIVNSFPILERFELDAVALAKDPHTKPHSDTRSSSPLTVVLTRIVTLDDPVECLHGLFTRLSPMKTLCIEAPRLLTQSSHRNYGLLTDALTKLRVTSFLSIESLELLGSAYDGVLLDFIRMITVPSDIQHLNVTCLVFDFVKRLQVFLDSSRPSLESIRLDVSQLWREDFEIVGIDLSLNTSLHTLHLHISMVTSDRNENWSTITDILRLAPPSLTRVIVGIEMNAPHVVQSDFKSVDWTRFEEALDRLKNIRSVTICRENVRLGHRIYKIFPLDDESQTSILENMKVLPSKGILDWSL